MTTPTPHPLESWEQREAQIRAERAAEFSRLSPEEQQKLLAGEKKTFEESQQKLRQDLGYGQFKAERSPGPSDRTVEDQEREQAVAEMEGRLLERDSRAAPQEKNEQESLLDLKNFLILFDAAVDNISGHKPFEFPSVALDDFGRPVTQKAFMRQIFDHSQSHKLRTDQIRERLLKKEARPEQISLDMEIDMGEDQNNSLGLTNLHLRLSLASLAEGHLTEKLARFTNLVYFAAFLHHRQQSQLPVTPAEGNRPRPATEQDNLYSQQKRRFAIGELSANGGLQLGDGIFEQGQTGTVVFSFNNGAVWGTFDEQGAPASPHQLQEALDKINLEK